MKSIEVYAFVGWIASFVGFFLYLIWAILPIDLIE